ncbi:MAG TPA: chemotaxis protein CheB [Pseudoxanthomonas sp.]|nr:chemotaxis protein CheB [Pseudoxanthomonas sp.]
MSANNLGKRVLRAALLARPGVARERLRQALHDAGANIVFENDPNDIECQPLIDAEPQVVLVALEAATDDSLARLDPVLNDPAITVIFDEAELAARREGWEASRWSRHLAAKLNGHGDVLPVGAESDSTQPQPGLPPTPTPTPAPPHADMRIEMRPEEAVQAAQLPQDGTETAEPSGGGLYLDLEPEAWTPPAAAVMEAVLVDGFGSRAEHELARPRPAAPAVEAATATAPVADAAPDANAGWDADASPPKTVLSLELEALEPDSKIKGARGALLLFAGIGGPDAVRKVLADLPSDLPRPVLVALRLDGGRYENLVKQMARVSVLPVQLAKAGNVALASHVYVLPNDVALRVAEGVVHFEDGASAPGELIVQLPAKESAVLLLSGSDIGEVASALTLAAQGAFVGGQSPQGCYDPAAAKALSARGGETGTPSELTARAVAHLSA